MRKFLMIGAAAAALFATQAAFAETPVGADKQSAIAVTIYNNDLALVRDSRTVTLTQGENDLAFIEVSAGIRPETALLTGRGTPLDIVEQNFDFDLLTPQKLLEKSVGQTIRVVRTNPETGADTTEDATVLSVAEGQVVLKIGDRIEVTPPGRLVYSAVPANLRDRPTLVVKLASQQAGDVPVDLSYLTRGLSWSADYVAELSPDEKTLNLNGWVTLTNMSGIAYNNAKLQLVAGEVNQYQPAAADADDGGDGVPTACVRAEDGERGGVRVPPLQPRPSDHAEGEPDQAGRAAGARSPSRSRRNTCW